MDDVNAKRVTGTGATTIGRARVCMVVTTVSAGGRLTVTDGSGGPTRIDLDYQAAGTYDITIPGAGVLFTNDPHVSTATNVTAVTLFWS